MYKPVTHLTVFLLALFLAISASYILSERDEFKTRFYGRSSVVVIPPNTNTTIPLASVSDRVEIERRLAILFSDWRVGNQSASIERPAAYSIAASLSITMQVNKSAFMLLEEVDFMSPNKTVDATVFHSTNFPYGKTEYRETSTIDSGIEINKYYQLKIGNYEALYTNQTGQPLFTIQTTNRTLEVVLGIADYEWDPPQYTVTVTFTKTPNLYVVGVLLIVDAVLITTYLVTYRIRTLGKKSLSPT